MKKILIFFVFMALVLGQACEKEKSKKPPTSKAGITGNWVVDSTHITNYVNGDMNMIIVSQEIPHTLKITQSQVMQARSGVLDTAAFKQLSSSQAYTDLDFNGRLDTTDILHLSNSYLTLEWIAIVDTFGADTFTSVYRMQLSR